MCRMSNAGYTAGCILYRLKYFYTSNQTNMQEFLTASPQVRSQQLRLAAMRSGIAAHLLEKDLWQSFVLKNVFNLPVAAFIALHGSRQLRPE